MTGRHGNPTAHITVTLPCPHAKIRRRDWRRTLRMLQAQLNMMGSAQQRLQAIDSADRAAVTNQSAADRLIDQLAAVTNAANQLTNLLAAWADLGKTSKRIRRKLADCARTKARIERRIEDARVEHNRRILDALTSHSACKPKLDRLNTASIVGFLKWSDLDPEGTR